MRQNVNQQSRISHLKTYNGAENKYLVKKKMLISKLCNVILVSQSKVKSEVKGFLVIITAGNFGFYGTSTKLGMDVP